MQTTADRKCKVNAKEISGVATLESKTYIARMPTVIASSQVRGNDQTMKHSRFHNQH